MQSVYGCGRVGGYSRQECGGCHPFASCSIAPESVPSAQAEVHAGQSFRGENGAEHTYTVPGLLCTNRLHTHALNRESRRVSRRKPLYNTSDQAECLWVEGCGE